MPDNHAPPSVQINCRVLQPVADALVDIQHHISAATQSDVLRVGLTALIRLSHDHNTLRLPLQIGAQTLDRSVLDSTQYKNLSFRVKPDLAAKLSEVCERSMAPIEILAPAVFAAMACYFLHHHAIEFPLDLRLTPLPGDYTE